MIYGTAQRRVTRSQETEVFHELGNGGDRALRAHVRQAQPTAPTANWVRRLPHFAAQSHVAEAHAALACQVVNYWLSDSESENDEAPATQPMESTATPIHFIPVGTNMTTATPPAWTPPLQHQDHEALQIAKVSYTDTHYSPILTHTPVLLHEIWMPTNLKKYGLDSVLNDNMYCYNAAVKDFPEFLDTEMHTQYEYVLKTSKFRNTAVDLLVESPDYNNFLDKPTFKPIVDINGHFLVACEVSAVTISRAESIVNLMFSSSNAYLTLLGVIYSPFGKMEIAAHDINYDPKLLDCMQPEYQTFYRFSQALAVIKKINIKLQVFICLSGWITFIDVHGCRVFMNTEDALVVPAFTAMQMPAHSHDARLAMLVFG
jgi:hypothetical protein